MIEMDYKVIKSNIEKMKSENNATGLINLLRKTGNDFGGDCDCYEIRIIGKVEDALEGIGRRTTLPFIEALRDKDVDVRRYAAWILRNMKDATTVEPLIDALKDKDETVRWLSVMALGDIGGKRAMDPIRMVPIDDDDLKVAVAEALSKIRRRCYE
jgi:hypothetical protein